MNQLRTSSPILLALLMLGIRLYSAAAQDSDMLIERPKSVAAAINTTAMFTCIAAGGDSLGWYVDGEAASHAHIRERNISYWTGWIGGNIHSILYVLSIQRNNNTKVECGVYVYREGEEKSDAVYLTVQGLLAAPGSLRAEQHDQKSILISWEHPFSLDGVPIIGYWVYNAKNNGEVERIELNSTTYKYSVANPSPCDMYVFQVSAINAGGEGSISSPIETRFHNNPSAVKGEDVRVKFEFTSVTQVKLSFTFPDNNSCSVQTTDTFTIHMASRNNNTVGCTHRDLDAKLEEGPLMNFTVVEFSTTTEELPLNDVYITTITRGNAIGNTTSNGMINASTFDVQEATIVESHPGNFCVMCEFAKGSNAAGCTTVNQERTINITALKDSDSAIKCQPAELSAGQHTFLVYDMEADGTVSDHPAVQRTVSVAMDTGSEQENTKPDEGAIIATTTATSVLVIVLIVLVVILVIVLKPGKPKQGPTGNKEKQEGDLEENGDYIWTDNEAYGQLTQM